jgi:rhodanese-related sulfurtransferase
VHKIICWVLVLAVSLGLAVPGLAAKEAPLVSKQTLKSWLNDPHLLIIDVRRGSYETSTKKIKGAVRKDPDGVNSWAATLPKDKKIVLYCS